MKTPDVLREFDERFGGQSELSLAILGALEYRGFNDAGKYLDDTIIDAISPIIKAFIQEKLKESYALGIERAMQLVKEHDPSVGRGTAPAYWGNTLFAALKKELSSIREV